MVLPPGEYDRGRGRADISGAGRTHQWQHTIVHSQARTFSLARCTLDRKVQVAYFFQLSQYKEVVTSLSASESLRWQFQVFHFVFWSSAWFPPNLPSCNFLNWLRKSLLGFIALFFALMGQLKISVFLTRFGNLITFHRGGWSVQARNANNNQCKPFNSSAPIYYNIAFCGDDDAFLKLAW